MVRAKVLLGCAITLLVAALLVSRGPAPAPAPAPSVPAPGTATPVVPVHLAGPALETSSPPRVGGAEPAAAPGPDDPDGPDLALVSEDQVGPCPAAYEHLPVVRRGLDSMGRPTWWHVDGSFTLRAMQTRRGRDGAEVEVPVVVHGSARPPRR